MARRGIIIANTGTPEAPEPAAVKRYLAEFLADPRICPMNPVLWQLILRAFILPRRSVASAARYRAIWMPGGSPLAVRMESLARKLQAALDDEGTGPVVRHAMSYGTPSMESALRGLCEAGCDEVAVVPLYPQSALSTTEVVADKAQQALDGVGCELGWQPRLKVVRGYSESPLYLDAIADSVRAAGFDAAAGDRLLFAFHSIPMADIAAGDSYGDRAHATAVAVARRLGLAEGQWAIGFQCRFDSRRWLGPFTNQALEKLTGPAADRALGNAGALYVVAPNFAVDCLETLYDIEVLLRAAYEGATAAATTPASVAATAAASGASTPKEKAAQAHLAPAGDHAATGASSHGQRPFRYVPCLNDTAAQVALLQAIIA